MIAQVYKEMLNAKSVIRQFSEFATARGKEIGYENVFDYMLPHILRGLLLTINHLHRLLLLV